MKWRTGSPSAVGWYEASTQSPPMQGIYRWWNGRLWSSCATREDNAEEAADSAAYPIHKIYPEHPPVRWRNINLRD